LKEGADCNFVVSPANEKLICPEDELPELVVELEELALLEGRSSIQGTAICLPPLELELLVRPELPDELLPELEPVPELVELVSEAPPLEPLLKVRTAKSTLPDIGLINTSSMEPRL